MKPDEIMKALKGVDSAYLESALEQPPQKATRVRIRPGMRLCLIAAILVLTGGTVFAAWKALNIESKMAPEGWYEIYFLENPAAPDAPDHLEEYYLPAVSQDLFIRESTVLSLGKAFTSESRVTWTYGDPWNILERVSEAGKKLAGFEPQTIFLFSCAARRTFWGNDGSNRETSPFQDMAPTSGFYTSGEFLRNGKNLNQHNVTLVLTGLREGEPSGTVHNFKIKDHTLDGQASLVNRLANFVQAATEELEDTIDLLALYSITDGLTKLLNRTEIQHRITAANKKYSEDPGGVNAPSLIMLDIDDFKKVNDTYGHHEGDIVLKGLAELMRQVCNEKDGNISIGRWGGEEFMILIPELAKDDVTALAEEIRMSFEEMEFELSEKNTISVGVTTAIPGEHVDTFCGRVDSALYEAKKSGKNRTVIK